MVAKVGEVVAEERRRRSPVGNYLLICALDGCDGASRLSNSNCGRNHGKHNRRICSVHGARDHW
jgi:hypothetical protein